MNADAVRVSLAIDAPNDAALLEWAIKHAEQHGYSVRPPNEKWENVTDYCKRLGVHSQTLKRAIEHPKRPNVIFFQGESGRLLELASNADFDAFVLRYKNRLKSLAKRTIAEGRPSRRKPASELQRARMAGPKRSYV
jgi:hypothetical protein